MRYTPEQGTDSPERYRLSAMRALFSAEATFSANSTRPLRFFHPVNLGGTLFLLDPFDHLRHHGARREAQHLHAEGIQFSGNHYPLAGL